MTERLTAFQATFCGHWKRCGLSVYDVHRMLHRIGYPAELEDIQKHFHKTSESLELCHDTLPPLRMRGRGDDAEAQAPERPAAPPLLRDD